MHILITGGAGFIGTNVAKYFGKKNNTITILDNFSRKGTKINLAYLSQSIPKLTVIEADVRNYTDIKNHVQKSDIVFHLAGQVAVTTSIKNPREDFESNLLGTFNILEAARITKHKPIILNASTNKVYGKTKGKIQVRDKRYVDTLHPAGISEEEPLDFHSPYGCSKGAADQYIRDYARIFDLPTVVFRQSCIYGQHQFGIEDQGWVAHFAIRAILGKRITIFGTGYQTRDILFIDDLLDVYEKALKNIKKVQGEIFNIGGGKNNAISLLALVDLLSKKLQKKLDVSFNKQRPGDQNVYISDITKAKKLLDWKPTVNNEQGLSKLINWTKENILTIKTLS